MALRSRVFEILSPFQPQIFNEFKIRKEVETSSFPEKSRGRMHVFEKFCI